MSATKAPPKSSLFVEKVWRPEKNSHWMLIRIGEDGQGRYPSFYDWFRMLVALCECEAEKYPNLEDPFALPQAFFNRVFDAMRSGEELSYEDIRDEFNLPR